MNLLTLQKLKSHVYDAIKYNITYNIFLFYIG